MIRLITGSFAVLVEILLYLLVIAGVLGGGFGFVQAFSDLNPWLMYLAGSLIGASVTIFLEVLFIGPSLLVADLRNEVQKIGMESNATRSLQAEVAELRQQLDQLRQEASLTPD